jgi:hypothetical protein
MTKKINFQHYYTLSYHIVSNDCNSAGNTIKQAISVIEPIALPMID